MKRAMLALLAAVALLVGCSTWNTHGQAPATSEAMVDADSGSSGGFGAESYRLLAKPDEIVSVLKNGLTVIVKRVATPAVSVQALVHTGSIYEGQYLGGGLSHLCEHLVAGGTTQHRSEAQNRDLLQQIGDNSNAYTSYEQTVYFVNTTPQCASEAIDLVTDWVFRAKITPEEYAREYQVVQRELEKDAGEADWVFADLTMANRYLEHPARFPVIGFQEVIRGLSRDEVYSYYKNCYIPQNVVLSIAGNADPEALLAAARKCVDDVKPGRIPGKALPPEPHVDSARTQIAAFPNLGQAKLELAYESVHSTEREMYALDLLAAVLGMGRSAWLTEELRDNQGLVTDVSCGDDTPYYVRGTFQIDMNLKVENLAKATDATLKIIADIKQNGVDGQRVRRAKTLLRAQEAMGRQTAEDIASNAAMNFLHTGNPDDTYADRIDQVSDKEIQAVARKYLDGAKLLTTILLPGSADDAASLAKAQALLRPASTQGPAAAATEASRVVLPNNTVLLLKRMASSKVVCVQLLARGGLSAEDGQTNGLGEFAMRTLPGSTPARSARATAEFFDSIGTTMDSHCGNNSWSWSATCLSGDVDKLLPVFADVVENQNFTDEEIAGVRERILADIQDLDRDWMGGGRLFFQKTFYGGSNSPYQYSVLGSADRVKQFTAQQARQYYQERILTAPRVLAIYGDIDVAAVGKSAEQFLGGGKKVAACASAPSASPPPEAINDRMPQIDVEKVAVQKTQNPQAAVFVGFESSSVDGEDEVPALLMAGTLTSGYAYPTGYIFETLRGQGLIYEAFALNFWGRSPRQPGMFWAYAACDPKNVDAVADGILREIARLQGSDADLDLHWFERSKRMVGVADALGNETVDAQAAQAAVDEMNGRGFDFHPTLMKRIDQVTAPEVRALAMRRLRRCVVTISTSKPELVKVSAGKRKYPEFPTIDLAPKGIVHDTGGGGGK